MHTVHPHSKTDRRKRPGRRRITSDGINRTYSAQDRYIQRAHIQHAQSDLHERREVRGVRTHRAHSAGARAAAELAAAARTAPSRAAMRPRRRLVARARRRLDARVHAAAAAPGARRAVAEPPTAHAVEDLELRRLEEVVGRRKRPICSGRQSADHSCRRGTEYDARLCVECPHRASMERSIETGRVAGEGPEFASYQVTKLVRACIHWRFLRFIPGEPRCVTVTLSILQLYSFLLVGRHFGATIPYPIGRMSDIFVHEYRNYQRGSTPPWLRYARDGEPLMQPDESRVVAALDLLQQPAGADGTQPTTST